MKQDGGVVTPLSEAIRNCPDMEARPDLILRLVDLIFLISPPREEHTS